MKQVFYISQWKRKPHIKHNCKLGDLRADFEIAEWNLPGHSRIANYRSQYGKTVYSGKTWQALITQSEDLAAIDLRFKSFMEFKYPLYNAINLMRAF